MGHPVVLLCKRGDSSTGVVLLENMTFECFFNKLGAKWRDLTQGCFSISYSLHGHPNCMLDNDEDLAVLYLLAMSYQIGHVDVVVKDLIGPSLSSSIEDGCGSSVTMAVENYVGSVSDVDGGFDMTSSLCDHGHEELKSSAWRHAIKGVDQVFVGGAVGFRDCLCKYSLFHGFKFVYVKNNSSLVKARCQVMSCMWFVKAKLEKPSDWFRIKEFRNEHSCGVEALSTSSSRSSSGLIGRIFSESMRLSPKRPVDVRKEMKKEYGVDVSYRKAWMAVEKARSYAYGDYVNSFKELKWFVEAFRSSNGDSPCDLEWDEGLRFKRLFVGFAASKYGFNFCLPLVFVDGTFLKGTHKGCLLAACAKDGNRGLYPLCIAIVDSENAENWRWFMQKLRAFLESEREVVFISDRHEGLLRAVESIFPSSPHSYCLVHLKANLRKHVGGADGKRKTHILNLFHRCACAPTVVEFDKLLSKLKEDGGEKVTQFLARIPNEHWAHPFFPGKRYGELTSNLVESFNNWIRKERRLPVTQLVDRIRVKLMDQMADRREAASKWKQVICPKMDRKLIELFGLSKTWTVVRANEELFKVESNPSVSVDIGQRSCSCGEWQMKSFPCVHAVCALKRSNKNIIDYVEPYYFSDIYREAYSKCINPVPTIWKSVNIDGGEYALLPPLCKRPPGRPRTARIPSTGVQRRKVTCGRCGQVGTHNRGSCKEPLEG